MTAQTKLGMTAQTFKGDQARNGSTDVPEQWPPEVSQIRVYSGVRNLFGSGPRAPNNGKKKKLDIGKRNYAMKSRYDFVYTLDVPTS